MFETGIFWLKLCETHAFQGPVTTVPLIGTGATAVQCKWLSFCLFGVKSSYASYAEILFNIIE